LYIAVMTPYSFGDHNDDALYSATARALATGQGYKIISLPYQPAQTKYPPVYPFLLSLIWRVSPNLPANLTAMMLLSVLAATTASVLIWLYLSGCQYVSRWWALLTVGLTALNVETVICSTGVVPEMPYTALSIGALLVAEARHRSDSGWTGRIAGGL